MLRNQKFVNVHMVVKNVEMLINLELEVIEVLLEAGSYDTKP